MAGRCQSRKTGEYISHNRTEKIQWYKFNSKSLTSWILIGNQNFFYVSRFPPVYDPNIMGRHRNVLFTDGGGDKGPKPDLDITKYSKFVFTDPLNFNLPGFIFM